MTTYQKSFYYDGRRYPAAPRNDGPRIMTARYASTCSVCKARIAAGEQIKWFGEHKIATHADDTICSANIEAAQARDTQPVEQAPLAESTEPVIADGYYTVKFGNGAHRTLRILTGKQGHFGAGEQIISYLSGPDNTSSYTRFGFVKGARLQVWKKFYHEDGDTLAVKAARALVEGTVDAGEAGRAYAMTSGNCYCCGRLLTDPESIDRGIGPDCLKKM